MYTCNTTPHLTINTLRKLVKWWGGVLYVHMWTPPPPPTQFPQCVMSSGVVSMCNVNIGLVQWGVFTLHIDTTPHLTLHIEEIGLVGVFTLHIDTTPSTWHYTLSTWVGEGVFTLHIDTTPHLTYTLSKLGWWGGVHIAHRHHPHLTYTLSKLGWWGGVHIAHRHHPLHLTLHIEHMGWWGGCSHCIDTTPLLDITHWANWVGGGVFILHIDTTPTWLTHWANWVGVGGGVHIAQTPPPTWHYTLSKLGWWGVFTLHIDTPTRKLDITHWVHWVGGGVFTLQIDTTPTRKLDITHWAHWVGGGCSHYT